MARWGDTMNRTASMWIFVGMTLLLGGCSINGIGLSDTDVVSADGATVITTRTYGVDLNTRPRQSGLSVGYSRLVQVLPAGGDAPIPGQYLFGALQGQTPAIAMHRRAVGLGVEVNEDTIGISLGLSEWMKVDPIESGKSVRRTLILVPGEPGRTMLKICGGEIVC